MALTFAAGFGLLPNAGLQVKIAGPVAGPSQVAAPATASSLADAAPLLAGVLALAAASLKGFRASSAAQAQRRRRGTVVSLQATRTEWYRKVKRLSGDRAVFDLTIPKPLGVVIEAWPQAKRVGCGISKVVAGGSADAINRRVCVDDEAGMWILEGDWVIAVDGIDVEAADVPTIVKAITENGKDEATLTLCRDTRKGPVKVVMMPDGQMETIRRGCRLSAAAEYAKGGELKYGCIDGWCGTCWHRERTTNGIFKPCCDVITEDWDSVVPMVLTPKPEKVGDATFMQPRGA